MALEGLCIADQDRQTALRAVETQSERPARILATEPLARERYLGRFMEHRNPLLHLVDQAAPNRAEQALQIQRACIPS
ncbi:hypothetical protein C7H84_03665 [Burkholderia sp. Nafp2/4-1b]|nr:hypothetical protein C7H84_03665 [Burkholderia sp. Nafp2/4-1b]